MDARFRHGSPPAFRVEDADVVDEEVVAGRSGGFQAVGDFQGRGGNGIVIVLHGNDFPQSSPSNQSDCCALHFCDIPALKVSIFNLKHDLPDIFTTFQDGVGVGGALDWQNGVDCRDNLPRFELGPDITHEAR